MGLTVKMLASDTPVLEGEASPKNVIDIIGQDVGNLVKHIVKVFDHSPASHPAEPRAWSPGALRQKIGTASDTEGKVRGGRAIGDVWSSQLKQRIGSASDIEGKVHGGTAFAASSQRIGVKVHGVPASPAEVCADVWSSQWLSQRVGTACDTEGKVRGGQPVDTDVLPGHSRKVCFLVDGCLVAPSGTRPSPPDQDRLVRNEPADPSPRVVCKTDGKVAWANAAWTRLSGYSQEEVVGQDLLRKLHGPATDEGVVIVLMHNLARQTPCSAELVCYDCYGLPFKHTLRVAPLAAPAGSPRLLSVTSDAVLSTALETSEHAPFLGCGAGSDPASSGAGRDAMWLWETKDLAPSPLAAALAASLLPTGIKERRSRTRHRTRRSNTSSDDDSDDGVPGSTNGGIDVCAGPPRRGDGSALVRVPPRLPYGMQASPLASLGWRNASLAPSRCRTTLFAAASERSGAAAVERRPAPKHTLPAAGAPAVVPADHAAAGEMWLWEETAAPVAVAVQDTASAPGTGAFPAAEPAKPTLAALLPAALLPAFASPTLGRPKPVHWFMPPDGPVWSTPAQIAAEAAAALPPAPLVPSKGKAIC